jgi:hypothetical protein
MIETGGSKSMHKKVNILIPFMIDLVGNSMTPSMKYS